MHSCARGELRCGNWRKSTGTVGRCKRRLEDASGGACNGKPVALQVDRHPPHHGNVPDRRVRRDVSVRR